MLLTELAFWVSVFLILIPRVVAPMIGGWDLEGFFAHETPLEVLRGVLDAQLHAEGGEVWSRVGNEASPDVDGGGQRRDVREAAEDSGVGPDQVG